MPERLVASLEGPPGAPVVVLGNSLGTTRELWGAAHLANVSQPGEVTAALMAHLTSPPHRR